MALKADHKYNGNVGSESRLIETQTGTTGYQVMLSCEDGDTSFIIWLTAKNRARALKYFDVLGVPPEKLRDQHYLDLQLGMDIEGREVSFGTKTETYNGKMSIKVAWIGRKSDGNIAKAAADFFSQGTNAESEPIPDSDIPF